MKNSSRFLFLLLGATLGSAAFPGLAATVLYSAQDLPDENGQNLWSYVYTVSGVALDETVDIAFDYTVHSPLEVLSGSVGWFPVVTPSDSALQADGHLALLNADGPVTGGGPEPGTFEVKVVRFAPGPLGAQSFEHYDGLFNTIGSGVTAPVPEPGTWALMLAGLGLLGAASLRARR